MRALLLLPSLAACLPNRAVDPPVDTAFTAFTACSDTSFHAWNDAGTVALSVWADRFLERSATVEDTHYTETLEIGVDDVQVALDAGQDVHLNFCTDGLSTITIDDSWTAVAGTVVLTVDWPVDDTPPAGSAALTDVVFGVPDGGRFPMAPLTLEAPIQTSWGG